MIVKMYFFNGIAFTFDELPDDAVYDDELIDLANQQLKYEPIHLYHGSNYLIMEECHPCLFEVDVENPEHLPCD